MGPARRLLAAAPVISILAVLWAAVGMAGTTSAATVELRVEGAEATLHERVVETSVHRVDGGDGTGPHVCSGPPGETPGPTVTGALDDAMRSAGLAWRGTWSGSSGDFLIDSIAGEDSTTTGPWSILLNGNLTPVGGCSARVRSGDRVLLARDVVFSSKTLRLTGAAEVKPGQSFSLNVTDERDGGAPVGGATVTGTSLQAGGAGPTTTTAGTGSASFAIDEPGTYRFKASHPDGIRSNAVEVCVGVSGCTVDPEPEGPPFRMLKFEDGQQFLRGAAPRILRGRLNSGSGVRLALRHRNGRKCRAWSGQQRRLIGRRCGSKPLWFKSPADAGRWTYRLGHLPPGEYRLFGRAIGVPPVRWRPGVNRIDFKVRRQRLSRPGLVRMAGRYLRRAAKGSEVRSSGLYSAWSTLALGTRRDRGAARAVGVLLSKKAARLPTGELARNLAALQALHRGPAQLRRKAPVSRRAGMAAELTRRQSPDGSFEGNVNLTAMAILALPRIGTTAALAADWLEGVQGDDGGLGHAPGAPPDVDTTGLTAWAFARAGRNAPARLSGRFLRSLQNDDGGFPSMSGGDSNAQSTGLAMAGIRAGGIRPVRLGTEDGITPFHFLAILQRRKGALGYAPVLSVSPFWFPAPAIMVLTMWGRLTAGP